MCLYTCRHQAASGKLNTAAVNEAASHAAAAVAGTAQQQQQQPDLQQQQQGKEEVEELGGSSAAAAAVDLANISNFISVGGAGNQMDSRGLRNLLLLHLRKVVVADLPEILDYLEEDSHMAAAAAAAGSGEFDGQQIGWRGGRGNLLPARSNSTRAAAAAAMDNMAAAGRGGTSGEAVLQGGGSTVDRHAAAASAGNMWGDFAVRQQQQQQQRSEPLDIGEDYDDLIPNQSERQQQQQQAGQLAAVTSDQQQRQQQQQLRTKGSVQSADQQRALDPQGVAGAAGAVKEKPAAAQYAGPTTSAAGDQGTERLKPAKRARFADNV